MYEAYVEHLEGRDEEALEILKSYQDKEFTRDEMELAGIYLYLCTLTGLYEDCSQALWKIQNFYMQKEDSLQLLWILLHMDAYYKNTPSMGIFMMEELLRRDAPARYCT